MRVKLWQIRRLELDQVVTGLGCKLMSRLTFDYHRKGKIHIRLSYKRQDSYLIIIEKARFIYDYHGKGEIHIWLSSKRQDSYSIIIEMANSYLIIIEMANSYLIIIEMATNSCEALLAVRPGRRCWTCFCLEICNPGPRPHAHNLFGSTALKNRWNDYRFIFDYHRKGKTHIWLS